MPWAITWSRAAGTCPGRSLLGRGAGSIRCAATNRSMLSARKGGAPVRHSPKTHPSEIIAGDQDVLRLYVAVRDAADVRGVQRGSDLTHDGHRAWRTHRPGPFQDGG